MGALNNKQKLEIKMQRTTILVVIAAMSAFDTKAVSLETEVDTDKWPFQKMTVEQSNAYEDYWNDEREEEYEKRGVVWGMGKGKCRRNCIKLAERSWYNWREILCPAFPIAAIQQECDADKTESALKRIDDCCKHD